MVSDPSDAAVAKVTPKAKPVGPFEPGACESDKDCEFDNPCDAHVCVRKTDADFPGCKESAPLPGSCVCAAHRCQLVRKEPATGAAKTGCKTLQDCELDAPTGVCRKGMSSGHVNEGGGFCACDSGTCTPRYEPPIHCKTSKDCSWVDNPRRPAAASKVPRPIKVVVLCKDQDWDSICHDGYCMIAVAGC